MSGRIVSSMSVHHKAPNSSSYMLFINANLALKLPVWTVHSNLKHTTKILSLPETLKTEFDASRERPSPAS